MTDFPGGRKDFPGSRSEVSALRAKASQKESHAKAMPNCIAKTKLLSEARGLRKRADNIDQKNRKTKNLQKEK
jgi:antitoxin component HigA of HigAB toxin-antitoxin module